MPRISDDKILDAALEVLVQRGYRGATTRHISAAAGITEVTLFRRFGSKKNLLIAAVQQEAENFVAAGIEYTGDLEADLVRIVQFYKQAAQTRGRMIGMLLVEAQRQPELLEVIQTPLTLIKKANALIERYQDEGALVKEPPMQALISLVGPLLLAGIAGFMDPNLFDLSFDPAEHVQRYLQGRSAC